MENVKCDRNGDVWKITGNIKHVYFEGFIEDKGIVPMEEMISLMSDNEDTFSYVMCEKKLFMIIVELKMRPISNEVASCPKYIYSEDGIPAIPWAMFAGMVGANI